MSMRLIFCLQGCHLMVKAGCCLKQRTLAILRQSHVWANPFLFSADLKSRFKGSRACFNTSASILWREKRVSSILNSRGHISGKVCFSFLPFRFASAFVSNFIMFCCSALVFLIKKGGMIHNVKREQINNKIHNHIPLIFPLSINPLIYRKDESTPTHDAPVTVVVY